MSIKYEWNFTCVLRLHDHIYFQDRPALDWTRNQESSTLLSKAVLFLWLSPRPLSCNSRNNPSHWPLTPPTSTKAKALSSEGYDLLWPAFTHSTQNPREEQALKCVRYIPRIDIVVHWCWKEALPSSSGLFHEHEFLQSFIQGTSFCEISVYI